MVRWLWIENKQIAAIDAIKTWLELMTLAKLLLQLAEGS